MNVNNLLSELITEQPNERTKDIDRLATEEMLTLINDEDRLIADAIRTQIPAIAKLVDCIVEAFRQGGRLFYVGAGTSGRIGILDASECPPTYGTPPSMVQGIIAGGFRAVKDPVEGAEDSEEWGASDIDAHGISGNDVVVGIAASGRTPFVLGAMKRAKERGACVASISNNYGTPMAQLADIAIEAVVGPEVVLGSTRMKSGTAQKLILNMLTTASMIRIGKVYGNLMVDLQPSNEKLVYRAKRIIKMATQASDEAVEQAFAESGGQVKSSIIMILAGVNYEKASRLLEDSAGFVRDALGQK